MGSGRDPLDLAALGTLLASSLMVNEKRGSSYAPFHDSGACAHLGCGIHWQRWWRLDSFTAVGRGRSLADRDFRWPQKAGVNWNLSQMRSAGELI